jgi:hypothetical protein
MGKKDEAGFYFRKAKGLYRATQSSEKVGTSGALKRDQLLEQKYRIEGSEKPPEFHFPYEIPQSIEGWE